MRGIPARFTKATDLTAPLAILESHGWIRARPAPPAQGRGRPAAPAWDVHPATGTPPHPVTGDGTPGRPLTQ